MRNDLNILPYLTNKTYSIQGNLTFFLNQYEVVSVLKNFIDHSFQIRKNLDDNCYLSNDFCPKVLPLLS